MNGTRSPQNIYERSRYMSMPLLVNCVNMRLGNTRFVLTAET